MNHANDEKCTLPAGIHSVACHRAEYSPDKPFWGTSRRATCSRIAVSPYGATERVRETQQCARVRYGSYETPNSRTLQPVLEL